MGFRIFYYSYNSKTYVVQFKPTQEFNNNCKLFIYVKPVGINSTQVKMTKADTM